jgi:hypothetical protein
VKDQAEEIEITPQMIEAGVMELCEYQPDGGVTLSEVATACFKAMASKLPLSDRRKD